MSLISTSTASSTGSAGPEAPQTLNMSPYHEGQRSQPSSLAMVAQRPGRSGYENVDGVGALPQGGREDLAEVNR